MATLVVVTGGSAGLGDAILATAPDDAVRVDVSRSGPRREGVRHIRADLADPGSWSEVGAEIAKLVTSQRWDRVTVVHSAGVLAPIGFTGEVDGGALARNVLVNSAAGQVLGHHVVGVLASTAETTGRREFVWISSGAARSSYPGWAPYGAAKAAAERWVDTVGQEQRLRGGVKVLAVAPGVVATGMQELIRTTDEHDFPNVERFRRLYEDGHLVAPADAAEALWRLLDDGAVDSGAAVDLRHRSAATG